MREYTELSVEEAYQALSRKDFSSIELTQAYLERIEKLDQRLNSYLALNPKLALETARKSDELRGEDRLCWLSGIPCAIKDVIVTRGLNTTAGSKILENFDPPYNAHVIDNLEAVYSPILGKTNCDEFAMGSSTENSAYNSVSNHWDLSRVPGGSSGGSAAAVAADLCAYALGTDTGGSIRQPAAFCGVVGLKPTYGRVSRYGLIAYGSSLDCIGPITKTVKDSALVLNIIAGKDPRDSTSSDRPLPDYSANLEKELKGLRIGIPREYFASGLQKDVETQVKKALKTLEGLGAEVIEVALPSTEVSLSVYCLMATSEASSNLSRYDGIRYGGSRDQFGSEVKRRIILGSYALSSGYYDDYYLKAAKVRTMIKQEFEEVFEKVDLLSCPVSPTLAFKKGDKSTPLEMYLSDVYTIPANLAGIPALSMPCGFAEGLPVGIQFVGPAFSEETLLRVGHNLESELNLKGRKPTL